MSASPLPPPPSSASLHGNDEPAGEQRSLRDYLIILRERLWIALPIALLVALSLGYYQATRVRMFSARATMQFERPERVVLNEQVVDSSIRSEIDLKTYLEILNSGRLRNMVVQSLTPDEIRRLQRPYLTGRHALPTPPPPSVLVGYPRIESIRNSLMISITAENRDPDGAAIVANHFVEQFMRYLIENVGGKNEFAVDYLRNRAEELRRESETAETRLQDYKRQNNLVSLSASVDIVADRLRAINTQLTTVRLARIDLETQLKQIERIQTENGNLLEVAYISAYGAIPGLKSQLADLTRLKSLSGERYLERHPKMIDLTNSIEAVKGQIQGNIRQSISDLKAQLDKVRDSEQTYEREFKAAERDQLRLGDLSVEFKSLENQAGVAKNNYVQILDRLNQTTTSKNLENIPVKLLDRAVPPSAPFTPNLEKIFTSNLLLGLVIFAGLAFGLSVLDDRIKSAWDVEGYIGAPLLGIIPELADVADAGKHSLVIDDKNSPGAEAFLAVYSTIKIQSKLDFPKSLMVTSTIPGEGKTMISCNLAASFARHRKRVLLIDADMRRPMLHRNFQLPNDAGLLTWYEAGASLPTDPTADPLLGIIKLDENLHLLRSGGRSKSPTEVLENPLFLQLLESLKPHFDLLVIDTPPMGAVSDALLIAERTDEVVYVCRFNRAYRKHIRLYVKSLRESRTEFLGIVLNSLSPRRIEYYSAYRYYRSYKKYYGSQS